MEPGTKTTRKPFYREESPCNGFDLEVDLASNKTMSFVDYHWRRCARVFILATN